MFFSKDYGVSWDEPYHRNDGIRTIAYLVRSIGLHEVLDVPDYITNPNGLGYSTLFDMFCFVVEHIFSVHQIKDAYLIRHALNFSIYFLGIYSFFLFTKEVFKNSLFGVLTSMFYLLHPRLLAHGFFNSKDSIAQALVACSLLPLYSSFKRENIKMSMIGGIFVGIAIVTRIPIIFLPFLFLGLVILQNFDVKNKKWLNEKTLSVISVFSITTLISLYMFQPSLWGSSIDDLKTIFLLFKDHPWDFYNFYLGNNISALSVPWHYMPVWILTTTPITFIFFLIIGIVKILTDLNRPRSKKSRFNFFMLLGFLFPVLIIIILGSTLYDGWRHIFFLYPFISYCMGIGFLTCYQIFKNKFSLPKINILLILSVLTFAEPFYKIITLHPHQNTYFNNLAGQDPMENFEGDYWGTSMRHGLEWIIEKDKRDSIIIASTNNLARSSSFMINEKDKKRLFFVEMPFEFNEDNYLNLLGKDLEYDYYVTNFRYSGSTYKKLKKEKFSPYKNEQFCIIKNQMKILGVYKNENH